MSGRYSSMKEPGGWRSKIGLTLVCIVAAVLLASACACADVTYKDGFKWTWFDYGNWQKGDLADSMYGRTAPGVWVGNPSPDKGSLSDAANAGKFEGTGSTNLWHYFWEPAVGAGGTAIEPKNLTDMITVNGVMGYFHGQMGLYKSGNLNGAGQDSQPAIYCGDSSKWFWVGFKAPRDGLYTFNWNTTGADRVDYGTQILCEGTSWPVLSSGSVNMKAGEFLYFNGFTPGGVASGGFCNVTVSSGYGTITGYVNDSYGAPIRGAEVWAEDVVGFTDDMGQYTISVGIGPHSLKATGNCYEPQTVTGIFIEKDQTVTQDFTLTAKECPGNLAISALATSMGAAGPSMDYYGNDGSRGTAFVAANVSGGWYQLDWPAPVTFTKMKFFLTGPVPLAENFPNPLAVQCWDETAQLWYTLLEAPNSAGVQSGTDRRLFEFTVPGGYPVTTAKLRLSYYTHPNPLNLEEWEIYNTPVTTASISGRVTDSTGVGKAYAKVSTSTGGFKATTGPDGTYHMTVQPGTYDVIVSRPSYETATIAGAVVGTDETIVGKDVVLARQPSGDIAPFANPYADYTVSVYPEIQAIDGNTGSAWYGTWDALADYSYYLDWGSEVTIKRIQFAGASISGWSLQTWDSDARAWTELTIGTGATGDYTVPADAGLSTTKFRLQYLADSAPGISELKITGVQGQGSAIKGTVRDGSGNPLGGALVSTPGGQNAVSGADGTYALVVIPGTTDITAAKFAYASQTQQATVPAGGVLDGVDFALTQLSANLAGTATFAANFTDSAASTASGNDGDRGTSWKMGINGMWNGGGWFELSWPSPVTFSRSRVYMPANTISGGATYHGLIFQKWDDARGVWSDWFCCHSSDVKPADDGGFIVDVSSPTPIITSKIRCSAAHFGMAAVQVSEWEVYNLPFSGASISGVVVNSATGAPLHHVLVAAGSREAYTDSNGAYSLVIDPGTYDLTASRSGYSQNTLSSVVLGAGQNLTNSNIALAPDAEAPLQGTANGYGSSFLVTNEYWNASDGSDSTVWQACYPSTADTFILDWGAPVSFNRVSVGVHTSRNYGFHLWTWNSTTSSWTHLVDVSAAGLNFVSVHPVVTSKLKVTIDAAGAAPVIVAEIVVSNVGSDATAGLSKRLPDGTPVITTGWFVTAVFDDGFYMQAPDRSCGIRVVGAAGVQRGDEVDAAGTITTDGGERALRATDLQVLSHQHSVAPLGMTNKSTGGGTVGLNIGVVGGVGENNLGLLVKTTGKVAAVATVDGKTNLWIDDGSAVSGPSGGSLRYADGFTWTLYDNNHPAVGDWGDAVMGRAAPGVAAGNPTGDAASLVDLANAGKSEGTGSTKLWYYLRDAAGGNSDPKTLLPLVSDSSLGIPVMGYWYGGQGFYKQSLADGVGVNYPIQPISTDWIWIGFKAPRTGTYSYAFAPSGEIRVDHGSTHLATDVWGSVQGSVDMNAGEFLYFTSHTSFSAYLLLTVTMESGGDVIGDSPKGVYVKNVSGSYQVGDQIAVTGISSVLGQSGSRYRVIRPRDAADIREY